MPQALALPRIPHDRAFQLFENGYVHESVDVLIHEQPFVVAAVKNVPEPETRQHYIEGMAVIYRALAREMDRYHDLLRENTRLNRRVDYLEAALRDVSEQEAKGKMAPAHECRITKILRVIPFWLFLLACLALPVFLYLAAREGGLLQ